MEIEFEAIQRRLPRGRRFAKRCPYWDNHYTRELLRMYARQEVILERLACTAPPPLRPAADMWKPAR